MSLFSNLDQSQLQVANPECVIHVIGVLSCLDSCMHSFSDVSGNWLTLDDIAVGGDTWHCRVRLQMNPSPFLCFWFLIREIKCFVLFS